MNPSLKTIFLEHLNCKTDYTCYRTYIVRITHFIAQPLNSEDRLFTIDLNSTKFQGSQDEEESMQLVHNHDNEDTKYCYRVTADSLT